MLGEDMWKQIDMLKKVNNNMSGVPTNGDVCGNIGKTKPGC